MPRDNIFPPNALPSEWIRVSTPTASGRGLRLSAHEHKLYRIRYERVPSKNWERLFSKKIGSARKELLAYIKDHNKEDGRVIVRLMTHGIPGVPTEVMRFNNRASAVAYAFEWVATMAVVFDAQEKSEVRRRGRAQSSLRSIS